MKKLNIAKLILETMPPIDNEVQDQLKDYIETNMAEVNNLIYSSSTFKNEAALVSTLIAQLRVDVCFQIFMKNFS